MASRPHVGVSSCLLGEAVRYDGTHRRMAWLVEGLGERVHLVSVCPEVGVGLGVPRPPIRLVERGGGVIVERIEDGEDLTAAFEAWVGPCLDDLARLPLAGYVLKANSPSCGVETVPIHDDHGRVVASGDGLFAHALRRRWPRLPVVDERLLETGDARRAFEAAVFAYAEEVRP